MSRSEPHGNALERLGDRLAAYVERYFPSPFVFAILLTYVAAVGAVALEGSGPFETVRFWYGGFWLFLEFSMQMVLILMTGFVLAYHPRVNDALARLARLPNDGKGAVALVAVVAMVLGWVHWGLGLIVGAIFARETGKAMYETGVDVHYPALCVAGYLGLGVTWHWGLSGSAPLMLATPGNEFIEAGVIGGVVPASETIFSVYALVLTAASIAFVTAALYAMAPSGEQARGITEYIPEEELFAAEADGGDADGDAAESAEGDTVPADRLDDSLLVGGSIAVVGAGFATYRFLTDGLDALTLDVVNFTFLMAGLAAYGRPQAYRDRFGEAASAAAPIVLLFPFFAGIQGIMQSSGLSSSIATTLFELSTPTTFPVLAWLTGAVVNLFVPSGGGEWIVIGPSVIEAAQSHGIPVGQATIAYAVGDAHTNLLNPFWALPLLAITRIRAREMFGYAVALLLLLVPFLALMLTVVPYGTL